MYIIDQDHEKRYKFTEGDVLLTMPVFHNGALWCINLKLNNRLLGSFDSTQDAMDEITKICNCIDPYYIVRGYSNFDMTEVLQRDEVAD